MQAAFSANTKERMMKHDERISEVSREEAEELGAVAESAISEADALDSIDDPAGDEGEADADQN
jgi:hypothetical protein